MSGRRDSPAVLLSLSLFVGRDILARSFGFFSLALEGVPGPPIKEGWGVANALGQPSSTLAMSAESKRWMYISSHSPTKVQGQDDEQDRPGHPTRDIDGDLGTLAQFAPRDGFALFPVFGDGGPGDAGLGAGSGFGLRSGQS